MFICCHRAYFENSGVTMLRLCTLLVALSFASVGRYTSTVYHSHCNNYFCFHTFCCCFYFYYYYFFQKLLFWKSHMKIKTLSRQTKDKSSGESVDSRESTKGYKINGDGLFPLSWNALTWPN